MVDLVIAEPNPLLRIGIRTVLAQYPDVVVAAEAEDAEQLLAALRSARHDVIVIGLGLLRSVGAARLREWKQLFPGTGILVHSYEWDSDFGFEASRFAATGYFSHECTAAELHTAILDVAAGKPFVTPALGEELAVAACFRADERRLACLSARERKLFMMLAIGMSLRHIAAQTGSPLRAVIDRRQRIMAKVDVPEASALVKHAIAQACGADKNQGSPRW